jgi:hypothetical protein
MVVHHRGRNQRAVWKDVQQLSTMPLWGQVPTNSFSGPGRLRYFQCMRPAPLTPYRWKKTIVAPIPEPTHPPRITDQSHYYITSLRKILGAKRLLADITCHDLNLNQLGQTASDLHYVTLAHLKCDSLIFFDTKGLLDIVNRNRLASVLSGLGFPCG